MDWETHMRRIIARLGEDATYTPAGGGASSTVRVLYKEPYRGALDIEGSAPTVSCMASDVPTLARGATFALRSTTFTVSAIENDRVSGAVMAKVDR